MRIAIIITGRIALYELGLLHTLNTTPHHIDLFISLNGEECDYYDIMRDTLKPWIKFCNVQKFTLSKEFCELLKPYSWPNTSHCRVVDGYFVPYNVMSMYYNEKLAMFEAKKFADHNYFEYDCYFKYRSDLLGVTLPENLPLSTDPNELKIFSPIPNMSFVTHGKHKRQTICGAWAWGNRKSMDIYCNTYDYVIDRTNELNGEFFISFECSLVDNLVDNNVQWDFIDIPYYYALYDKTKPDYENRLDNFDVVYGSRSTNNFISDSSSYVEFYKKK